MLRKGAAGKLLSVAAFALVFLGVLAVAGGISTDAATPSISEMDYDTSESTTLTIKTTGISEPTVLLSIPSASIAAKAIDSPVGEYSVSLSKGTYSVNILKVSNHTSYLGAPVTLTIYQLNLDLSNVGESNESMLLSTDSLSTHDLSGPYVWNTMEDGTGDWVDVLSTSLFETYQCTLYAFEPLAPLDIVVDGTYVYDGSEQSVSFKVYYGETLLVLGIDYEVVAEDSVLKATDAGKYPIKVVGLGPYGGTEADAEWEIEKAASSWSTLPAGIPDLVYDGSAQAVMTAGTAVGGEAQYKLGDGAYGTDVLTATDAGEYTVYYKIVGDANHEDTAEASFTVEIAKKSATVTADDKEKTYGEDDPELTATVTGLVGEDTLTYTVTRESGEAVGTYTITPAGAVSQGNYTVSYVTGELTITAKPVDKPVGAELQYSGEVQQGVPSDAGYTLTGDYEAIVIGEYTATATLSAGYIWSDDTTAPVDVEWSIVPKEITATADDKNKTFGTEDPELTATVTGLIGEDKIVYTVSRAAGEAVGTYDIAVTGDATQGYYHVTYVKGTFTINPAEIAKPVALIGLIYDGTEQTGVPSGTGYTLTGDKATNAGDHVAVATLEPGYVWNDASTEPVNVNWSIAQKTVTVKADDKTMGQGQDVPELTATVTGLIGEDTVEYELATTATKESPIGTYDITVTGTASQGNYYVSSFTKGTLTIKPSVKAEWSTVPVPDTTLVYNKGEQGLLAVDGASDDGIVKYKVGTGAYSTLSPKETDAGTYVVSCYIEGDASHLDSDVKVFEVTIAKKAINPEVTIDDWTYGEAAKTPTVTGNPGEGAVTYTYAVKGSGVYSDKVPTDAGEYTVKAVVAETDNYLEGTATADFEIYKAPAVWTVEPVGAEGLVYVGVAQKLLKVDGTPLGGTAMYSLDGIEYVDESPSATLAGTYKVYFYVEGDSNHIDSEVEYVNVTITENIAAGKLHDVSGYYNDDKLCKDYGVSEVMIVDGVINVTVSGKDLVAHENGIGQMGYWAGIAVLDVPYGYGAGTKVAYTITVGEKIIEGSYTLSDDPTSPDYYDGTVDHPAFVFYPNVATYYECTIALTYDDEVTENYAVTFDMYLTKYLVTFDGNGATSGTMGGQLFLYGVATDLYPNLFFMTGCTFLGWSTDPDGEVEYADEAEFILLDRDGVTLYAIWEENIAAGKLHDESGYYDDDKLCKDYDASIEYVDDVVYVTISGVDLKAHENGIGQMGYWAGFAVVEDPYGFGPGTKVAYVIDLGDETIEGDYVLSSDPESPFYYDGTISHPAFVFYPDVSLIDECTVTLTYDGLLTEEYVVSFETTLAEYYVTFDDNVDIGEEYYQAFWYGIEEDLTPNEFVNPGYVFLGWATEPDGEVEYIDGAEYVLLDRDGATLYAVWEEEEPTPIDKPTAVDDLEYDGTEQIGVVPGEGYTLSGYMATDAGKYTATATLEEGYIWSDETTDPIAIVWSIAPREATITVDDKSKVYGDVDPELTGTVVGLVSEGDLGEIVYQREVGKDVGDYEIDASYKENSNYDVTVVKGTLTITQKTATVTADDKEKTFGAADPTLTATVEGVIDDFAIVYTVSRAAGEAVGTYAIIPTGDASQGNYAVSFVKGTFTITAAEIDKPKAVIGLIYDGSEQIGVPSGTGYTLTNEKAVNAGKYTATATLEDGYKWSDGSSDPAAVEWSIAKKALDNGMVTVSGEYTYNGKEQAVSYTVSDKSGDKEIITANDYSVTSGDKGTNAGFYALILDATEDGNYYGQMSAMWSIAQKAATVTADDKTKPVGSQDPTLTATVDGVIDDFAIVYTVSRAEGETIGTYDIIPSGEESQGNYAVSFVKGTFTITGTEIAKPEALIGLIYSGSEQTGVPSGDGYKLTGTYKATNAGAYTATATLEQGYIWSDGTLAPVDVEWGIAQKMATVTADDKEKTVGTTDPTLTAKVEGVIDDYAIVYTISRETGETIGTYAIIPTGEVSQGNYAVEYVNGVFSIVYEERTIVDESGKVSATGEIAEDAQLVVTSKYDPADWENVDLSGKDIIKGLDISISSATEPAYTGTLDITIELGSKYNGTKVTVYHHHDDGSTESFTKTVHGGKVTVTVSDLSPFLVATERASPYVPGGSTIVVPSDANTSLMLAFAALTLSLIGLAVVIYKRK